MTIPTFFLDQIVYGDSLHLLSLLPDQSIDLIFADPPYNLQLKRSLTRPDHSHVNAVTEAWDQFESFTAYDTFCTQWLTECKRILKPTGSLWVIGSYHNIFRLGTLLQNLGFWILNDIVWIKPNPMPNFHGTRFNNAHETLIWAITHEKAKYTFHYQNMKIFNDDKQMRSDWYIPICTGTERLRDKENGQRVHPTQKPEALLQRILLATSNYGDIVLDPFAGSGTSAVLAKRFGRHFIAFEKDAYYVEQATIRLAETVPLPETLFLTPENKHFHVKVPFGALIETGIILPGQTLYFFDRKTTGIVQANGCIACHNMIDSIHKVAAALINQEHANGWEYWYVEIDGKLIALSILREKYLSLL